MRNWMDQGIREVESRSSRFLRAARSRCTSAATLANACAHRAPHPLQLYPRYLRQCPAPEALSTVHPGLRAYPPTPRAGRAL
jgi:hypothetical protein